MSVQARHTRCPQCKTRFRVTEEQLSVAGGKVRCGQCRTIFNARAHLLSDPAPAFAGSHQETGDTAPPSRQQAPGKPAPPEDDTLRARRDDAPGGDDKFGNDDAFGEDDELIFDDDPEEDATETSYAGRNQKLESELSSSFLSLEEEKRASWREDTEVDPQGPPVDESWADSLLDETDTPRESSQSSKSSRSSRGQTPPEPPSKSSPEPPIEEDDWETTIDWDSLDNLPEIPDPIAQVSPPSREKPQGEPRPSPPPASSLSPAGKAGKAGKAGQESKLSLTPQDNGPKAPPQREPGSDWRQLRAEPVTPRPTAREPSSHRGLWAGLALLLVVALGAQLLWVQKETLSRNEHLRPFYGLLCEWTGCQLPPMVDRSQLASRDLLVRNHPEQSGALLVEARLHNKANFPQPLPAIVLSFSNLNGDIVAQRVFRPSEYLADQEIPREIGPNRALPIRLSLQDPGREAINYRLDFLSLSQP